MREDRQKISDDVIEVMLTKMEDAALPLPDDAVVVGTLRDHPSLIDLYAVGERRIGRYLHDTAQMFHDMGTLALAGHLDDEKLAAMGRSVDEVSAKVLRTRHNMTFMVMYELRACARRCNWPDTAPPKRQIFSGYHFYYVPEEAPADPAPEDATIDPWSDTGS